MFKPNNPITGSTTEDKEEERDTSQDGDLKSLPLRQLRGFNGTVMLGLVVHPSGSHFLFPVGSNIIVEEITTKCNGRQEILEKHNDVVTALCVSPDGRYIASAERAPFPRQAQVILWEFHDRTAIMRLPCHKCSVTVITFLQGSHNFVTLGDEDDGKISLWSTIKKGVISSNLAMPARSKTPNCLAASKTNQKIFVTGGAAQGRIWTIADNFCSFEPKELNFTCKRHNIICIEIADKDCHMLPMVFCGTTSGDILIFSLLNGVLQASVPKKPLPSGVTSLTYLRMLDDWTFNILAGTGEGKVISYDVTFSKLKTNVMTATAKLSAGTSVWSHENVSSPITSISKKQDGKIFYVGSCCNSMLEFNLHRWSAQLVRVNSNSPIYALAFPRGTDDLLVTGGHEQVKVINLQVVSEARRYVRRNRTCYCLAVNHDGTNIFTGWDTGDVIVLGFEPNCMTLKELFRVDMAQKQPVFALALTSESSMMVTGGGDGQTRVWRLVDDVDARGRRLRQALLQHTLTDTAGPINTIQISHDDTKCLASSQDGTAVVYDLSTGHRVILVKWDTSLNSSCFCTQDAQLITANADGVVRYWEIVDGSLLREVIGTKVGAINTLSMRGQKCPAMQQFVTGADDALVKLWDFNKATVTHVGKGHGSGVLRSMFGPCGSVLVTSGNDGSLCIWDMRSINTET